jgi:hypothetical protein
MGRMGSGESDTMGENPVCVCVRVYTRMCLLCACIMFVCTQALLVLISRDARQPHRVQPALLQEGRRSGPWHDVAGVLRAMHGSKDEMTHVTAIYTLYVVCYRVQWALLSDSAHGVQLARGLLASLGRFPGSAAVQASACWVLKSSYRLRGVAVQEGALRHVAAAVLAHAGNMYVVVHAFELLLDLVKEYVVRAQFRSADHGGADALAFLTGAGRLARWVVHVTSVAVKVAALHVRAPTQPAHTCTHAETGTNLTLDFTANRRICKWTLN